MTRWIDRHPLLFLTALTFAMGATAWQCTPDDGADAGVTPATVAPPTPFEETNE